MCLGIPMQVIAIDGLTARCNAGRVERDISLFMLQGGPVIPGDFLMAHLGYATRKLAAEDARATSALLAEMLAVDVGHA